MCQFGFSHEMWTFTLWYGQMGVPSVIHVGNVDFYSVTWTDGCSEFDPHGKYGFYSVVLTDGVQNLIQVGNVDFYWVARTDGCSEYNPHGKSVFFLCYMDRWVCRVDPHV